MHRPTLSTKFAIVSYTRDHSVRSYALSIGHPPKREAIPPIRPNLRPSYAVPQKPHGSQACQACLGDHPVAGVEDHWGDREAGGAEAHLDTCACEGK